MVGGPGGCVERYKWRLEYATKEGWPVIQRGTGSSECNSSRGVAGTSAHPCRQGRSPKRLHLIPCMLFYL